MYRVGTSVGMPNVWSTNYKGVVLSWNGINTVFCQVWHVGTSWSIECQGVCACERERERKSDVILLEC